MNGTAVAESRFYASERRRNMKKYRQSLPAEVKRERNRATKLRRFGLEIEEFEAMSLRQGGVCAICRKPETRVIRGRVIPLSVDHDHETRKVRGLLCAHCNTALGMMNDDPITLGAAITYLRNGGV